MNISMNNVVNAMRASQYRMDVVGNNIANTNTKGFKSQSLEFGSVLADANDILPDDPQAKRLTPKSLYIGNGSIANLQRTDFELGTPEETNLPTDLYIEGNAYFQVTNGQDTRYTRMGALSLADNGKGQMVLAMPNGDRVLDRAGNEIVIPPGYSMEVGSKGEVKLVDKSNKNHVLQTQQIALYQIPNRETLESAGNGEFTVPANALSQPVMINDPAKQDADVPIKQGYLEQSNVNLQKEMTTLMENQRFFQFNSRALTTLDQMEGVINSITGK